MASATDSSQHVGLVRSLGLFDITMIGVGAMIGAGIFVLTGIAAGTAGPALILAFALNGVITVLTAMVYAELGSAIPEAGGGYLWVKEGLPGPNGFLAGWMSWFAHAVAGSLYGVGFGGFIYELMRILLLDPAAHHDEHAGVFLQGPLQLPFGITLTEGEVVQKLFAVLIILLFLYINYRGTSETGAVGNIVTVLKVIIIGIFIVSGLFVIFGEPARVEAFQPFDPNGIIGIVSAMGLTFIAFEGYEIIVQAGEEVREPRKNIPRAVFLSLAIVVPIYMLVAVVIIGAVDPPEGVPIFEWLGELGEIGIARAAAQFMPFGTFLIMVGGLLSTMSALNATTFSSTRVSFAMGRDRALPDRFSSVSAKTRTPHVALGWSGVLILFVALTLPIEDVAASADIMFILLFLQVNLAVITIRGKYGKDLKYGFLLPFFPILPMIAIGMQFLLLLSLFNVSILAWVYASVWVGGGLLIYFFYANPRQERAQRSPVLQQTELMTPVLDAPYRVLVPVANPDSLTTLLPPAVHAAKLNNGKVTLLHIVTVPSPTPLSSGYRYLQASDALQKQAIAMVADEDVAVEYIVRVARRIAPAIIDTAREQHADLVVIGWQGTTQIDGISTLGANIDRVLAETNCDVMMLQPGDSAAATRILVPVAEPRQVAYSLGLVQQFSDDLQLDLLHVFSADATSAQRERTTRALQRQIDAIKLDGGQVNLLLEQSPDRIDAIVQAAKGYDYVVLGVTREPRVRQRFTGGNTSMVIADRTDTPVLLVHPETSPLEFGLQQTFDYLRGGYRDVDPESRQRLEEHGYIDRAKTSVATVLKSSISQPVVMLIGVLTVISAFMMYAGGGNSLTWTGALLYFGSLLAFTFVAVRAARN
ncbi:MAG: amino acid permease [Chloroflexi bacterium]|nr:amino acid permease [Chloroflexota bacterium]MCY3583794.1 amino acid permease [Chloroflexota bacterium]MCY3716186.1 amino acid permease [Chloroflexota bacterium]MDE2650859.1 amino acid permease [Chloroflexota bacterium]MXX49746.1 amino acid permease [Chloroflexota bacterium]